VTRRQRIATPRLELSRLNIGQRPLDAIDLVANHADGLLMRRKWHGRNGFDGVTDLVVPVPHLVDLRRGEQSLLVNLFGQLHHDPGERQPEHHFDGQPVGRAIEIEEQEAVNGFTKSKGSEDHGHSDQTQR
jgi:hypothetical protein